MPYRSTGEGAAAAFDLGGIAHCLAHYPPRSDKNSLLERLLAYRTTFVLLVVTGRCTDPAARFSVDNTWLPTDSKSSSVRLKDAKSLLKEFGRQYRDAKSDLELKRKKHCKRLSQNISATDLRSSADRLRVEERVTQEFLKSECERMLRSDFLVPNDRLDDAINALAATVRNTKYESRRTRKLINACPKLLSVTRAFTSSSVKPTDYVMRGEDESQWRAALTRERTLLLSGRPRCGKSYASLSMAAEFQSLGYEVKLGTDVEEASRYLLDNAPGDRFYVLDDPLGALQPTSDAFRAVERLRWLIPRLPANRRLVVAQSQDQLFEILGKASLDKCTISNVEWRDLSSVRPAFLAAAWKNMVNEVARREDVAAVIEPALRKGVVDIELGCLRHLASTLDELPANPDLNQIVQHARQDAKNLGLSLARSGPDMTSLLLALAVGSGQGKPLALQELAFLLDHTPTTMPGKSDAIGSYIGSNVEKEKFPSYSSPCTLPNSIEHQMDTLEQRRFITVHDALVQFAHPFYRAAAQNLLLESPTNSRVKEAVRQFERALFSLSPLTATAAIQNAEWLCRVLASRPKELQQIFMHVEEGLNSLFPIVRDQCFEFLLRHLNDLDPEQKADRAHWVSSALSVSLEDVSWHDGHAWIPSRRNIFEAWDNKREKPSGTEISADVELFESGKSASVPPARAARVLNFYAHKPEELSLSVAQALLGYEEALIRAGTARQWLEIDRMNDSELIERIFQDSHPAVILESFERCALSWHQLNPQRQAVLKTRLEKAATSEVMAVALLPQLVVFDREEYFGEDPPWDLFGAVMPRVFSALPERARFVDARLYSVMETALGRCSPASLVSICNSWLAWLRREAAIRYLDEYSLSVADILVRATRRNPELRGNFVQDLLSLDASAILIYVIRDLVGRWADLQQHERKLVLSLFDSKRADEIWLRAVAITRRTVPKEIQELILGNGDSLDEPAATLTNRIPMRLLVAAVAVQCGKPGVFWNLAHSSKKFGEIVRLIAKQPSHSAFKFAFRDAIYSMHDERVKPTVDFANADELEKIFRVLLKERVEWTGNFLPLTWAALLSRVNQETRMMWIGDMAEAAPACIDDLGEIREWLSRKEDQLSLLELLHGDALIVLLSRELVKADKAEQKYIVDRIRVALNENPPKLFGTYDELRTALNLAAVHNDDLSLQIASLRERSFGERGKIEQKFSEPDPVPTDWVRTVFDREGTPAS
jgi:hypothetical protein